ncbi:MAG: ABC transporter permease subunit [Pigmentiphaga sp.]
MPSPSVKRRSAFSWHQPRVRALVYQVLTLGLVLAGVAWLLDNTLANLATRRIASGFGFLQQEAGFAIGETPIPYEAHHSYGRAILVGILNTLRVSAIGIVLATVLGLIIGLLRLSPNGLLRGIARCYVEVFRNTPLLLQLFLWYALITDRLPAPRQAIEALPGIFLSNRGLALPTPADPMALTWAGAGLLLGVALLLIHAHHRRRAAAARALPGLLKAAVLIGLPVVGLVFGGERLGWSIPEQRGFGFSGGVLLSPEFATLLIGLVSYTSAFIAEIVRAGIQAVPAGQWEAASSIGLSRWKTYRLVVLPQALRVMVPPMTSQYLNLIKNSSLAVAIGYPDLVSVINTTLNQTGQAIEGVALIMAAYLTISLSISLLMNAYNRRIQLDGARP